MGSQLRECYICCESWSRNANLPLEMAGNMVEVWAEAVFFKRASPNFTGTGFDRWPD